MRLRLLTVACVSLLSVAALVSKAHAQLDNLASRIPADANCLVIMDVDKILASPAANDGDWKRKVKAAHAAGMTLIPPGTNKAIYASQIDLEYFATIWQSVILQVNAAPSAEVVAKRTSGTVDQIGTLQAVRLPQDAFVVLFPNKVYGVMAPANRQACGRWVSMVASRKEPVLSPYLSEAYKYANDAGTPIILALDVEGALSEAEIASRVEDRWEEAGLQGKANPADVAKTLAGLRGLTLGITLRDKPFGKIKMDFTTDVEPLADVAKPLFLHVLDHRGLTIEEFEDWKYVVKGKQVTLEGFFTKDGLRRIFSVFDRPPAFSEAEKPEDSQEVPAGQSPGEQLTPEQSAAQATLSYFTEMADLVKDLKRTKNSSSNYSSGSIAQWCKNYARKIDRLPILNVDPEMLDFGNGLSQTLSQASMALKTGNSQGAIAAMNVGPYYNFYSAGSIYGTYRYGYVEDVRSEMSEKAKVKRASRSQSMMAARQILDTIEPALQDIRRKMTEKYQIEFPY